MTFFEAALKSIECFYWLSSEEWVCDEFSGKKFIFFFILFLDLTTRIITNFIRTDVQTTSFYIYQKIPSGNDDGRNSRSMPRVIRGQRTYRCVSLDASNFARDINEPFVRSSNFFSLSFECVYLYIPAVSRRDGLSFIRLNGLFSAIGFFFFYPPFFSLFTSFRSFFAFLLELKLSSSSSAVFLSLLFQILTFSRARLRKRYIHTFPELQLYNICIIYTVS